MNNLEIVHVISPLLDSIGLDELESSISKIFDKIPDSKDVKKLDSVENYEKKIVQNLNFEGLANFKYIESCCWLFNEIENMIKAMIHQKESTSTNRYIIFNDAKYENHISILAMTTDENINTPIKNLQKDWADTGYQLPFLFVKDIVKKKGYNIESFSDKTHPDKVDDKGYHNSENYETPVEIFELVLKYENVHTAIRRQRLEN
jgi:hypothetical protein